MKPAIFGMLVAMATILVSQPAPQERVGPRPDGGFLLNSGWKIQPAGRQIALDTMPMSTALSPDGAFLLVLNGGYRSPSIIAFRVQGMQEIGRTELADGWLGLTFSRDGKFVYAGGGSRAAVFEFSFAEGKLQPARTFAIVPDDKRTHRDFIGDVAVSPDGRLIYAAGLFDDAIHVINPQSGRVIDKLPTGRRPYRILFHPDGKSYFVSSWADGSVYHHKAETGERIAAVRIGQHPTDMVFRQRRQGETDEQQRAWASRIFVAAANTNNVYVVGLNDSQDLRMIESINLSMTSRQPLGMTPSALSLNADQSRLFVACSDANAIGVVNVAEPSSMVEGYLPAGWYPTAVRALTDGRLLALNGRGVRSYPNPNGPNPEAQQAVVHRGPQPEVEQYVARMQTGTMSVVEPFDAERLELYTESVRQNSPYRDNLLADAGVPPGNPVPTRAGDKSPIEHVIYIVKENRTFDQVFGDLGKGNGDPKLVLFDEKSAPNHRKLAREFVLFDNFYVNADVDADGHNWAAAAIAPDYVQKLWPNSYGGRRAHYDYEGGEPAAYPPAGYLWTNAAAAGITMRNYGWWATNLPQAAATGQVQISAVRDPILAKVTNTKFRAFDTEYPDTERAKVFVEDLREFEKSGMMPRLILMRLGNDHTSGTAPGKVAPLAAMADNDHALGTIVEAVSKSRFWPKTAIFVIQDDAQNGPDHVDSHRAPALVLSPWTRRGAVDSTMYNTASVLRTIELIVGLRPMTHFDAAARPMWAAFSKESDLKPYEAVKPAISPNNRNSGANTRAGLRPLFR